MSERRGLIYPCSFVFSVAASITTKRSRLRPGSKRKMRRPECERSSSTTTFASSCLKRLRTSELTMTMRSPT